MQKAILVGLDHFKRSLIDYYMEELKNLALTLNIETITTITQDQSLSSPQFKVGTGKVKEIKQYIEENDEVNLVIFNDELSNSQIRNLEELLEVPVIDRTLLILDIFAKRAKTKEAMLQVEVAQLKYLLPRLTAMHQSFERQQGGIGSRGPGEKKIELSRRHIEREINQFDKELKQMVKVRQVGRKQRLGSGTKTVAIVGYTNAGKSSLMNTLIKYSTLENPKEAEVKDQVFQTLETSTRQIQFPHRKLFTLTDTIGFVSHLPHDLVESFKATLEEIKEADLLLHVIDFSHPYYFDQILTTQNVLKELGADAIETLYVFNKIDLANDSMPHGFAPSIKISLKTEENIDELLAMIPTLLFKDDITVTYAIPHTRGDILNTIIENAEVINKAFNDDAIIVKARVSKTLKNQLKAFEQ